MKIFKDNNITGQWWLPDKPNEKVFGTLDLTKNQPPKLQTISEGGELNSSDHSIILGFTENGQKVTLIDSIQTGNGQTAGDICLYKLEFTAQTILIGEHFSLKGDVSFSSYAVTYNNLGDWVYGQGFINEKRGKNGEIIIESKKLDSITTAWNGFDITVSPHGVYTTGSFSAPHIAQSASLDIKSSELKHYQEVIKVAHTFQNFLTLITTKPARVTSITGFLKNSYPVQIFTYDFNTEIKEKETLWFEMLFRYQNYQGKLSGIIKKWFNDSETLESIHNLYFSTYYAPHMYLESKALFLAQVLEAFHRCVYDKKDIVFGKRLEDILNKHESIFFRFVQKSKFDLLIQDIKYTRNYFTHWNNKQKSKLKDIDLDILTIILQILIEICFLSQLNFTDEEMTEIFRHHRYANILKLNRTRYS